jgi:hypothetical protein
MATRYHLLPTEVLERADSLDYYVMDVSLGYQRYLQDKEEAKSRGVAPTAPEIPVNKLQEMIKRVRK